MLIIPTSLTRTRKQPRSPVQVEKGIFYNLFKLTFLLFQGERGFIGYAGPKVGAAHELCIHFPSNFPWACAGLELLVVVFPS